MAGDSVATGESTTAPGTRAFDPSCFIILLARQRSGTNALRSILETHPDIFCLGEIFNFADRNSNEPLIRGSNFFNFLLNYAAGDLEKVFPDRHEAMFLDYLEFLRCFTPKRYILLDVKYNTTHFLAKPWLASNAAPYLFELIKKQGMRVLRLRRKHYLRYILSVLKAFRSTTYVVNDKDNHYKDIKINIHTHWLLDQLAECYTEDLIIDRQFAAYPKGLDCEYAEIFSGLSGAVSPEFLDRFSSWLGIANNFNNKARTKKQAALPLQETIENYEEVRGALSGTEFEYCLQDEF